MKKYLQYLKYVLVHKYWVMVYCFQYGLYWQGITHDLSKFLPDEFFPYANHFFSDIRRELRDKTGYYKPTNTGDSEFDYAWFLHQCRNKHHWQYWIVPDFDKNYPVQMPDMYLKEMYCDWLGAGKAQGTSGPHAWYAKNKDKMILHPISRSWIEKELEKSI